MITSSKHNTNNPKTKENAHAKVSTEDMNM